MIPLSRNEIRDGIISTCCNKSGLVIQQNITILLRVDYIVLGNQSMSKQQKQSFSTTSSSSQHFSFFTGGVNFCLSLVTYFNISK